MPNVPFPIECPDLLRALNYPPDLPCVSFAFTELHPSDAGATWTGRAEGIGTLIESGPAERYAPERMAGHMLPAMIALNSDDGSTL